MGQINLTHYQLSWSYNTTIYGPTVENHYEYLHQGGYIFHGVYLSVHLFVSEITQEVMNGF